MKNRSPGLRKFYRVLSAFFLGVFTGPIVCIVWFLVPWLRDFPVGDDSPTGIGLPVGFCIGAYLATALNRRLNWGRSAFYVGAILLITAIGASAVFYSKMTDATGWDGLGWLIALVTAACAVISFLGLMLAGMFSNLGEHVTTASSNP